MEKVTVPKKVYRGLKDVLNRPRVPKADDGRVRDWLYGNGYPEAATWIYDHKDAYFQGVVSGFRPGHE
jgi:hypothetical protein